ncbi:MAG: ferrochelatase [Polyangiaceae bacterium]
MATPTNEGTAVLLVSHGTVDDLADLPGFLRNIRRGHAPSPELVAEVRKRYEAIGGKSPLNDVSRALAEGLEKRLEIPVRMANRLWKPYASDVLASLARNGVTRVIVLPLAQHSAHVYGTAVETAALELTSHGDQKLHVKAAPNWGKEPLLVQAYADAIRTGLRAIDQAHHGRTTVVLTAHSLPKAVIAAGDPYEREVRESAELVAKAVGEAMPRWVVAFQSQGLAPKGTGEASGAPVPEWLGPGLEATFDDLRARGDTHVLVAPVGFLADHVEILYDIDIEAKAWAADRGLALTRTASLNTSPLLLDTLEKLARGLLADGASRS